MFALFALGRSDGIGLSSEGKCDGYETLLSFLSEKSYTMSVLRP